jgi:hypothetical protein
VFENRVLKKVFGTEMDELVGNCRRLLNRELHNLHASLNIIRAIKSRKTRWVGHVACMG